MIKYLEIDEVYEIHEEMINIGGGRKGMRDFILLHSSLERPKVTFGGEELYPTIWDKAAALIYSLIKNHAFNDGNKRTGFFSTMRFLKINEYYLTVTTEEVVEFSLEIDIKNPSLNQIATWLKKHSRKSK